jgi:DNA-binding CsgD family transcriptional regulator
MVRQDGWSELFWAAFKQSRNPMALLDVPRRVVDVNGAFLNLLGYARADMIGRPAHRFVVGGPLFSPREWAAKLAVRQFTGEMEVLCADDSSVVVQWGADTEVVTGRRLVLLVVLSSSRWGARFRRSTPPESEPGELSEREREVLQLVAQGQTDAEIADELHISHNTARTHVRNAMTKTGTRSRAHLVAKALGDGHALA